MLTLLAKWLNNSSHSILVYFVAEVVALLVTIPAGLFVEGLRQERGLRERVALVRAAVNTELQQNLDELRFLEPSLRDARDTARGRLRALQRATEARAAGETGSVQIEIDFGLPAMSFDMRNIALSTDVALYLDYQWVIDRGQDYGFLEQYLDVMGLAYEHLGRLSGILQAAPEAPRGAYLEPGIRMFERLYGQLDMAIDLHEQLEMRLQGYLATEQGPG